MSASGAEQRVIAILGAGGTLGEAIAAQLAGEPGTALVVSDVSAPSLEATIAGLPDSGGPVETVLADVSDFGQVEAVVARALDRFGHLDVLVSNAGVLAPNGRIHNLSAEDWDRTFQINVMGSVNAIRSAVPPM
ncbi:MAG TPA: SDR family NAD(P)-dependent oxidoreductase, partial [Acidimicrobiales bacterium]|nr:SDR family NAD(P)-dependent oxidoreductase [Acidimicrobiales bacterium]